MTLSIVEGLLTSAGGQPKNAKGAIVQILSREFPLATKQLNQKIKREYGMSVTYQAVHKALQELEKEKVVTKFEKDWALNSAWLIQQESFIGSTIQKYAGNKNRYNINLDYEGPQVFEFDNFTDVAVETAKLVANRTLCKNKETAYWVLEYGWWSLKFKFEHLELLYKLMINSPRSCHLIRKVTPFGKWTQKQYERVGGIGRIGVEIPVNEDLLIQGDWIVQIQVSDEGKKIIEKLWNKWKNLEDCYKEFGLKEEPKITTIVKITKNPELAGFMRKQIEEYLPKGKNHE